MPKRTAIIKLRAAEQDKAELEVLAAAFRRSQSDTIRFLIHQAAHELAAQAQPVEA